MANTRQLPQAPAGDGKNGEQPLTPPRSTNQAIGLDAHDLTSTNCPPPISLKRAGRGCTLFRDTQFAGL